jgi:hypothetical protein
MPFALPKALTSMSDAFSSGLILLMLGGSASLGQWIVSILPEHHRSRETIEFTRLVTALLVTFTALVLSLLITSVNSSFEKTESDLRSFAAQIIRLTDSLDDYGPETAPIRTNLRRYTASAIASTWPEEPAPSGDYPRAVSHEDDFEASNLGEMLRHMQTDLLRLDASNATRLSLRDTSLKRLEALLDDRWTLIGEARSNITGPFYDMMALWLFVVFLSFGMSAPRKWLSAIFIVMVAISVSGAFFVILELDGPLDGLVKVSSEPMLHALRHLDWSLQAAPKSP